MWAWKCVCVCLSVRMCLSVYFSSLSLSLELVIGVQPDTNGMADQKKITSHAILCCWSSFVAMCCMQWTGQCRPTLKHHVFDLSTATPPVHAADSHQQRRQARDDHASAESRDCGCSLGRPHSADKKFVRARGPQNWNPEVFDQTRCSRILHVEFPLNNRELVKAEVFDKRVFEQTTPFKLRK